MCLGMGLDLHVDTCVLEWAWTEIHVHVSWNGPGLTCRYMCLGMGLDLHVDTCVLEWAWTYMCLGTWTESVHVELCIVHCHCNLILRAVYYNAQIENFKHFGCCDLWDVKSVW